MHSSFYPIIFSMVGSLPVSSSVNTELKSLFKLSATSTLFVITFPSISLSGPTLSFTCCLLMMYAKKLLLSSLMFAASLCSKYRLDFLIYSVVSLRALYLYILTSWLPVHVFTFHSIRLILIFFIASIDKCFFRVRFWLLIGTNCLIMNSRSLSAFIRFLIFEQLVPFLNF